MTTNKGLQLQALLEDNAVTPEVDDESPPVATDEKLPVFSNFDVIEVDDKPAKRALSMNEICEDLYGLSQGWPKRADNELFVPGPHHKPRLLRTTAQLFAWLASQFPVDWGRRSDMVTQEQLFEHLQETAEQFDAVEHYPHWPPLPNTYYMHPELPESDGGYLEQFVSFFLPLTSVDRELLKAFIVMLVWGGTPGTRPAWLFTSRDGEPEGGRGVGKSKTSELCCELVGGFLEISPLEDIVAIKKRLLSPAARTIRMARIDNVKTLRFSWADLEGLITSPVISGHRMYKGEGRRPNTISWVVTLNGASLSRDFAKRVIVVKLKRPTYSPTWESEVRAYIEHYRWHILNDAHLLLEGQ